MASVCLTGGAIRVGYPSRGVVRQLPRGERRGLLGHVVLALTGNRHYALRGVRPGSRLAGAARRFDLQHSFHAGGSTWFIVPGRAANGLLQVRHGIIKAVGIANRRLTITAARARRFLHSFF